MLKNIFNLQMKFVIFLSRPNRNLFVTFQQEMYNEKCFFQRENSEVVYFENGFFKQVEKKRFVRVSFGMRAFFLKQHAVSSLARNIGKISFFTLFARYSTLCIFIQNVFVSYIYFQKPDFERFSRQSKKYLLFQIHSFEFMDQSFPDRFLGNVLKKSLSQEPTFEFSRYSNHFQEFYNYFHFHLLSGRHLEDFFNRCV